MSKLLSPIALLLVFSISSFSQQINPQQQYTKEDYLKKSKSQKTVAFVFLGGGTVLAATGIVVGFGEAITQIGNIFSPQEQKVSNTGEVLFYTGLVSMASSIPFFIASSKNKKKANSVLASFKMESRSYVQQSTIGRTSYPALSLKLSL